MGNTINTDKLYQTAAQCCKEDLSLFVRTFWGQIIPDKLEWNWHMQVLCDELQYVYKLVIDRKPKEYDLIINIPPGTSKSTICTIMAQAWSWTVDPTLRHITGSYSDALATEHSVKMRDLVNSDLYKAFYPEIKIKPDENNKTNYKTLQRGQRYTTSVGASVTGIHAHIITVDDPLNPKQAASDVELSNANDWLDSTLSTRKVDKELTPTILIMQRLHMNDCTGHLLSKDIKIKHINLPAEDSEDVRPLELRLSYKDGLLDTKRLSRSVLANMLAMLGTAGYAAQFEQRPVPKDGLKWRKWFKAVPDMYFPMLEDFTIYRTYWDLAYTENHKNSACAYITAGVNAHDNTIWIYDLGWDWLEAPELIKYMSSKPAPHMIEAKASGKSMKQTLVRQGINAIEMPVVGGDKVARSANASPVAEAGRVYVKASLIDKLYNDPKQGILYFPNGVHDDLADVLAMCLQDLGKTNGTPLTTFTGNEIRVAEPQQQQDTNNRISIYTGNETYY